MQAAQITTFGMTSMILGAACHNAPNGGYRALAADQPQSLCVIRTLAR